MKTKCKSCIVFATLTMLLFLPSMVQAQEPAVRQTEGTELYQITMGDITMAIDAAHGAKIRSFKLGDKEVISQSTWPETFGSTFWTSPQKEWNWPPVPEYDKKPYEVQNVEGQLIMTSQVSERLGYRIRKSFMKNSVGGSVGAYIYNVNIELVYHYGLSSSEEVFWNDITSIDGSLPYSYTYKASSFGAKIGYGICIGKRFCLTPQVGIGSVSISGTEIQKGENNPSATKGYTLDLSLGVRMEYIIFDHFGVMISPEYDLAVSKSDLYTRVSEVSSKVKNYGTGFNIRVGLFATF